MAKVGIFVPIGLLGYTGEFCRSRLRLRKPIER